MEEEFSRNAATERRRDGTTPRAGDSRVPDIIERAEAGVAQTAERLICNQQVAGSIPTAGWISPHLRLPHKGGRGLREKMLEVEIIKGDLLKAKADAIVNPANSHGWMGGGVAGAIKRAGGSAVEKQAVDQAPIAVGRAILTTAGQLPFAAVVHAPTMEEPGMLTTAKKAERATYAALDAADIAGHRSIAFPGMGTGVGGVSHEEAAEAMIRAIADFEPTALKRVLLVAMDDSLAAAWRAALARIAEER